MSGAEPLRAAGGVLWRPGAEGPQVAVVHRPRYDDWSLPKGKLDPGEDPRETAVRELREETGFTARLGRALGESRYRVVQDGRERDKTVQWWSARCLSGRFSPTEEVDALEWLSVPSALERVTAGRDAHVLRAFAGSPAEAAVVVLLRHGSAGSRQEWHGEDDLRPLDARGQAQAVRLADLVLLHGPRRVLSAPPLRCVQTVQPLADRLGLPVEVEPLLGDTGRQADPDAALALVAGLADGTVACSQGDALPRLLAGLQGTAPASPAPKGAGHVLSLAGGRLLAADPLDPEQRPVPQPG